MKKLMSLLLIIMMLATSLLGCTAQLEATQPEVTATPVYEATEAPAAITPVIPIQLESDTFGNSAVGTKAAVTSANALTSGVGMEILEAGGNAIDAAVAMLFANSLTEPGASTIGGAVFFTIYMKETNSYHTIDGLETVPAACTVDLLDAIENGGPEMLVTVPGQVHAALTALEKYGTMTPAEVLAPVIKLADEGFDVFQSFEQRASACYDTFVSTDQFDEAERLFTNDGLPYAIGDHFENPDYANTLRKIAEGGIDAFYKGDIAQTIVDFVQSYGGVITMEDFANYSSVERDPVMTDYHGYTVVTVSNPSTGGVNMIEALNILENFDLVSMGFNTPEFIFAFNEAYRIARTDGMVSHGDPDYWDLPTELRVDKEYAASRATEVPAYGTIAETVAPDERLFAKRLDTTIPNESNDTTQVAVIDEFGNMVSTTMTIGGYFGGCTVAPGTGFALNAHLLNVYRTLDRIDNPNFMQPGLRIGSTMCPTIVVKDGEPVLALGSPGSAVIPILNTFTIIGITQFGVDPQELINMPRAFSTSGTTMLVEDRFEYKTIAALEQCGYTISNRGSWNAGMGSEALVYKNVENGWIIAASDNRRQYRSFAY